MVYRTLGRTGLKVSEVGLGCEHLENKDYETVKAVIDTASELGVNILDVFMSQPQIRADIGRAIAGRREQFIIQGHFGPIWKDGQYTRSRDLEENRVFFEDLLTRLNTGYIDVGMIHFIDSQKDYDAVFNTEIIHYVLSLKEKGIITAVGLSSHNAAIAKKAVDTGLIDVLMFSVNPAYDLLPAELIIDELFTPDMLRKRTVRGIDPERDALYNACVRAGCAVTVMKTLCGGMLLKAEPSPFGEALTVHQCMHYALTRPAAASVLIGCQTAAEMRQAAAYEQAPDEERDFSKVLTLTPQYAAHGRCVYCNHCLPCASKINIAQVNKLLDLATVEGTDVKATVAEHYKTLDARAGDCVACGQCEPNCPFGVPIIKRMRQASEVFGC